MIILPVERFNTKHLGSSGTGRTICLRRFIASLNKTSCYHDCRVQSPLQPSSFSCLHFSFFSLLSPYSHHTSCGHAVLFCTLSISEVSVQLHVCFTTIGSPADITASAIWSYARGGVAFLSAAVYCFSVSTTRLWLVFAGALWSLWRFLFFFPGKQNTDREKKSLTLTFSEG